MKLTKAKLLQETRDGLIKLGYKEVKDNISSADGLFIKPIAPGFFLTLGFTKSRFYDSRFTADFYLSKITIWSAMWGDIPRKSSERIGVFLTEKERKLYLDDEQQLVGSDAWWQADRKGDFQKFLETVRITEERFLNQEGLFEKIENSAEVKELVDQVNDVFAIIDKGSYRGMEFKFIPEKKIGDIPGEWFKAAEIALGIKERILNKNTVKRLAADAWRQKQLYEDAFKNGVFQTIFKQ